MEMLINVKELNEVCALPDRKYSTETHFNLANREMVHEVFGYQKFQDDFADNIRYVYNTNDKSFIGTFKPSYDEFIRTIIRTLNLKSNKSFIDNEELTKLLLERVDLLSGLQDRKELRGEFPELNNLLTQAQEYWDEIEHHQSNPIYKEEYSREGNGQEHYFFQCGLRAKGKRKGFDGFVPAQAKIYKRFVTSREQYKKLVENYNYDDFIKNNYDINKLAMYMAHKYLTICEENMNDRVIITKHIKLIERYMNSIFDKKTYITINHKVINYQNIIDRTKQINDRLKKVDGLVGWKLVPKGEREKYIAAGLDPHKNIPMTQEEINRLRDADEKRGIDKDIYIKHDPLFMAYGTDEYEGYIAYIYPNGRVVLDAYYDPENPDHDRDNAIFSMNAKYFEMVSGLKKIPLGRHPMVDHKHHKGAWKERMIKIITQEGTAEDQKEAQDLVNRIIEANEKRTK